MAEEKQPVVREEVTPFLLKIYVQFNGHNSPAKYTKGKTPSQDYELQMYTWKDATLRELTQLIQEGVPEARESDAHLAFRLMYLNTKNGNTEHRELEVIHGTNASNNEDQSLEKIGFITGDYLDVAIWDGPPRPTREPERPRPAQGGGGGGGRDRDRRGRRDSYHRR
ncbi:Sin3 associated polypeptide p18-domain-containing protein [Gongronella butleri]|nr:Sin3 associated polypeptide p18-domain-containing protein [Gongronella butleri]